MIQTNLQTSLGASFLASLLASLLGGCGGANQSGVQPIVHSVPTAADPVDDKPVAPPTPVFPDEAFRNTQPTAGPVRDFNLPGITQFKLGKQIDVFLVERHNLPTISADLNFNGGSVTDKTGYEGTASICMSMMSQGTKKLDKLAFETARADLASWVYSYAGDESQGVGMRTLTKNFDATFSLFRDTLLEPGLRKEDLGRMVKRSIASLQQSTGSPRSVARRVGSSIFNGPKNPLGKIRTEKSLNSIKIEDCRRYVKAYIRPQGARLFIVGDLTEEQIREKFSPLLTVWKGRPKKIAKIPQPHPRKGRVFFIDMPGAAQSAITIGHLGPRRNDPEYFANLMMGNILGGGFSSRINMNLREDKGYSYGARGNFGYNRHFGSFRASSAVRSNATRQSLQELFSEMQRLKSGSKPATDEELRREQNGSILGLPGRFATSGQVLGIYRRLVYFGLPMDYYNQYVSKISAVTLAQVQKAAAKELHPDSAIVLVVGDGKSKQIVLNEKKDNVPRMSADDVTQMTLLDTLSELAASELGGKGKLVILDRDGRVKK